MSITYNPIPPCDGTTDTRAAAILLLPALTPGLTLTAGQRATLWYDPLRNAWLVLSVTAPTTPASSP